jgi:hypothetical protein
MAKELPYFKFEPNQWENGNIQICSREDKGLFIDLCSMYWARLGDVPLKLAVQKLCAGNASAFDSLCDDKIIEVIDGNIFIKFLSEQLNEFEDLSEQNSKNALLGWEKRRANKGLSERNASASIPQCENDAIREEEIREDEIKVKFNFYNSLLSLGIEKDIVTDWLKVRKTKKATNSKIAFDAIAKELELVKGISKNEAIKLAVVKSWSGFKAIWVTNELGLDLKANDTFDMDNPPSQDNRQEYVEWMEERQRRLLKTF